jgi:hypothetical protein
MKIFYSTNGISKRSEKSSVTSKSIDDDLESIPSISDYDEQGIKNKYKSKDEIKNLKTIKEATVIEDSENSSSLSKYDSKYDSKSGKGSVLEYAVTKKISSVFDTDSSNYNDKMSVRDRGTIIMENNSNRNIEFSEVYSEEEMTKKYVTVKTELTPYKPEEINKEIYPDEDNYFMKFNDNSDLLYKKIINNYPNNLVNHNNLNNNLNISICSTEISFSISSKYENIDELSDFKYSKTPKLRKKIKSILKDFDNENEFEFDKYKTNKYNFKKTNLSEDSFHKIKKNDEYKKSNSNDIFKRKKQKHHSKDKSSEDNIINITTLKNPNFNFLKLISGNKDKNTKNYVTGNELPTFNQLIQNVLNKEKLINHKDLESEKEQLSKKLERIRTMKSQKKTLENEHKFEDFS